MSRFERILVTGANGQVGSALIHQLGEAAVGVTRAELDLDKPQALRGILDEYSVDAVINAAAYTAVDKAEEETEAAMRANGEAPGVLAAWARDRGIPFVHYSTDYVFPGDGDIPWTEEAATGPKNAYGSSKLAGEKAVQEAGGDYLILRTSWVYDAYGKNFLRTMLRLGAEREKLRIVSDQIGAPSYAPDLAEYTLRALEAAKSMTAFPSGVYHFCHAGETSWHGFALAIFEEARRKGIPLAVQEVEGIASSEFPTPASRPQNSRMSNEKFRQIFGFALPDWRDGLARCMELVEDERKAA